MLLAGEIARKSVNSYDRKIRVAASIPPIFGSYKADFFDYEKSLSILKIFKDCLVPFSDLILAETLSCKREIEAVQKVFSDCNLPLWVSCTLEDDNEKSPSLRSGESLSSVLSVIDINRVSAVLFNCSQPEVMSNAIRKAKDILHVKIMIGVYANSFHVIKKIKTMLMIR